MEADRAGPIVGKGRGTVARDGHAPGCLDPVHALRRVPTDGEPGVEIGLQLFDAALAVRTHPAKARRGSRVRVAKVRTASASGGEGVGEIGVRFQSRNSAGRAAGCSLTRWRTSACQTSGSMSFSLAVSIRV